MGTNRATIGKKMTLYCNRKSRTVRIIEIEGGTQMQQHLAHLGIRSGEVFLIKRAAPLGGPVLLERDGVEVAIGRRIAERIIVEDLE